jgi:hypothetical protein
MMTRRMKTLMMMMMMIMMMMVVNIYFSHTMNILENEDARANVVCVRGRDLSVRGRV